MRPLLWLLGFLGSSGLKNPPAKAEGTRVRNRVQSLDQEDPLGKEMTTHLSTLTWKIPGTEEPGRLQSMVLLRVGHDWARTHCDSYHTANESGSLCTLHKWNHTKCILLCLASFPQHDLERWECSHLLFLPSLSVSFFIVFHCVICLFHRTSIWAGSSLRLLWLMLLQTFLRMSFDTQMD